LAVCGRVSGDQHQLRTTYKYRSLWDSSRSGSTASRKHLPREPVDGIAGGPDDLDILSTSLDVAHIARARPAERSQAQWRSVPVLADTGAGHGSAEQLRLMHNSSGLVAATRRTLPLPFQYTRATGSHFPTQPTGQRRAGRTLHHR